MAINMNETHYEAIMNQWLLNKINEEIVAA
jgi:hypothetical protein